MPIYYKKRKDGGWISTWRSVGGLRVNRKLTSIDYTYHLKGHALKLEDCTKYLGIELSNDIQWNHYIDKVVQKGNSMLY